MKLITRPIIIDSLEWTWALGWVCCWRPVEFTRGVPDAGTVCRWTLRGLFRRLDWWTEPVVEADSKEVQ